VGKDTVRGHDYDKTAQKKSSFLLACCKSIHQEVHPDQCEVLCQKQHNVPAPFQTTCHLCTDAGGKQNDGKRKQNRPNRKTSRGMIEERKKETQGCWDQQNALGDKRQDSCRDENDFPEKRLRHVMQKDSTKEIFFLPPVST
jgi:hypothetical protein